MPAILSQAVAAGAVQQQVIAAVWSILGVSWPATWFITSQDPTQVTLGFTVPAPAAGGTVYYTAVPGPTPQPTGSNALSDYLTEVRRLLHDAQKFYFSDADLTADINYGIRQRDLWSGGSRSYQPNIPLTAGVDQYRLSTTFPLLVVLDVVTVWLIYGSTRVQLDNRPFSELTNMFRPWTSYQGVPGGWTRYGADQVFVATAGAAIYTMDWDLVTLSTTLVNPGDLDPLIFPYTEPVPYFAAYKAKINQRRFDEAEVFMGFAIKALRDIEGARVGEMISAYGGSDWRTR